MILALLLAQGAVAPAPDDIVVQGERLKNLRVVTRRDRRTGAVRCVFKHRSGDPVLDAGVCEAMLACVPKVHSEAGIRACMAPAMSALVPKAHWEGTQARDD